MDKNTEIIASMPTMKSGKELIAALATIPQYDKDIATADTAVRLVALSELYSVYIPSRMSLEIYSKLYLALLRSLQKKGTKLSVQQRNENCKAVNRQEYNGIIGGSDSFTIIGTSGIGKSSAISKAISLITGNGVIEVNKPHTKIIPCVVVQCPFDSSVKGLLLEILRKVDEYLESKYYQSALKVRATTDMLIGNVSQVALNHIGLLVVDEIQNVANSKNGKSLIGVLTQLINNSGISIAMVGTPESSTFFEQAFQLARRSLGLQYGAMEFNEEFTQFCRIMFEYQYVCNRSQITDAIIEWLYEHSSGIISVVVTLIHDAQEIAILNGREILDLVSLNEAYSKRHALLHNYMQPTIKKREQTARVRKQDNALKDTCSEWSLPDDYRMITELVDRAKREGCNIVDLLKKHITVEEVAV